MKIRIFFKIFEFFREILVEKTTDGNFQVQKVISDITMSSLAADERIYQAKINIYLIFLLNSFIAIFDYGIFGKIHLLLDLLSKKTVSMLSGTIVYGWLLVQIAFSDQLFEKWGENKKFLKFSLFFSYFFVNITSNGDFEGQKVINDTTMSSLAADDRIHQEKLIESLIFALNLFRRLVYQRKIPEKFVIYWIYSAKISCFSVRII